MELAIITLKEEEIFIIGEYGLVEHCFSHTKMQLDHLIASLVRKLFLFGILLNNLLHNNIEIMTQIK
jgi:hypothetical protein